MTTYLLLADSKTYVCRTWEQLVHKLVWARAEGYRTAKARRCSAFTDRPLMPSECAALIKAATQVALDSPPPTALNCR